MKDAKQKDIPTCLRRPDNFSYRSPLDESGEQEGKKEYEELINKRSNIINIKEDPTKKLLWKLYK